MKHDTRLPDNTEVRYLDFGIDSAHGFVTEIEPGHYLIGINTRCSHGEQRKALEHEIYHIEHGHLDPEVASGRNVNEVEAETHGRIGE